MSALPASTVSDAADQLTPGRETLHYAVRNPKLLLGFGIVVLMLVVALVGPVLLDSKDPNEYVGP